MKLKALFMEEPVDFEKRCRLRILVGKTAAVLGLLSVAAAWFYGNSGTVAGDSFIQEFYTWIGIGFMAGGAASVWKNRRYLKDEAALKKRRVEECDERNRLLGLRSWAYSGYAMFLLLYLGFLASGFFDLDGYVCTGRCPCRPGGPASGFPAGVRKGDVMGFRLFRVSGNFMLVAERFI